MKARPASLRVVCVYITTFFISVATQVSASPQDPSACSLDFTQFLYQPTGDCDSETKKINAWGSFPTTLCCRNALTVLSKALTLQASVRDNIFINESQWRDCNDTFQLQHSVSIHSCRFDHLFYGSSKCSTLSVSEIMQYQNTREAASKCAQFNPVFDETCVNCSAAILHARDNLLEQLKVEENGTEKAICGVAVVISIAAEGSKDPAVIDDLYRCLHALDVFEPGYFKMKYSLAKALLAIAIATIGLTLVIMLIKYVTKSKNNSEHERKKPLGSKEIIDTWSSVYRFSKAEIENAIIFGNEQFLGRGSAGQVYKGILPSGQVVAIKHLYKGNATDSFTREVDGLSRVRHPNLVCLFGCCVEDGEQYLVYEYCSAGNLAHHLLRKDVVLTWEKRVRILRDCALALRYLHHYVDGGCLVHRDIKLTNILLTENLDPKLSDFGLAKLMGMEQSKVYTDVRGTIGYMDPEYMSNAKLTCASDIYSFGIVTLQVLSGQKVIELDLVARDQLTRKAKDVSMGKRPLKDFEDAELEGNLNVVDFESILHVAVLCVAKSSIGRPTIDVVFDELDKAWKNTAADMRARKETST